MRYGRFLAAKKVAMALVGFGAGSGFPQDTVDIVGFYSRRLIEEDAGGAVAAVDAQAGVDLRV